MLFAGGWPLDGHSPTAVVDIWDYATMAWSTAKLSIPRMYMMAGAAGHYAAFAGGLAVDDDSSQVDVYNALTGT